MTSSKQIERGSRQKRLEIQLLQPTRASSSYLTRSYTLSNGSLNSRSCCIQGTELRSFLTLTRLLVYFLLGFFLYATIYAGLGSMVKRQDEVQSAIVLPQMLLTSGYVLIFLAVQSPDATWVKVLSFIPFWTPTLMLVRIAAGTVYWWDIAVSMVLMLVTICACAWFSVRIYRFGVLMYGQKPGFGQLLKLARMN